MAHLRRILGWMDGLGDGLRDRSSCGFVFAGPNSLAWPLPIRMREKTGQQTFGMNQLINQETINLTFLTSIGICKQEGDINKNYCRSSTENGLDFSLNM